MIHNMKLHPAPFEMIKSGEKTIELRLFDEKRQQVKVGDKIIFINTTTGETLNRTVVKLHRFDSFEELYKSLPLLQCGYTVNDVDVKSEYLAMEKAKSEKSFVGEITYKLTKGTSKNQFNIFILNVKIKDKNTGSTNANLKFYDESLFDQDVVVCDNSTGNVPPTNWTFAQNTAFNRVSGINEYSKDIVMKDKDYVITKPVNIKKIDENGGFNVIKSGFDYVNKFMFISFSF